MFIPRTILLKNLDFPGFWIYHNCTLYYDLMIHVHTTTCVMLSHKILLSFFQILSLKIREVTLKLFGF